MRLCLSLFCPPTKYEANGILKTKYELNPSEEKEFPTNYPEAI